MRFLAMSWEIGSEPIASCSSCLYSTEKYKNLKIGLSVIYINIDSKPKLSSMISTWCYVIMIPICFCKIYKTNISFFLLYFGSILSFWGSRNVYASYSSRYLKYKEFQFAFEGMSNSSLYWVSKKIYANLYCICLSIDLQYTKADAVLR